MKRLSSDSGLTLVELLATIVIAGVVMTIVVTVGLFAAEAINTNLSFNQAQRTVLAVSSGITSTLKRSDYVEVQYTGTSLMSSSDVTLQIYQNGYMSSTAQYSGGVYRGVGASGLQGAYTALGTIEFQNQNGGTLQSIGTPWTVTYTDHSGITETLGTVEMQWDYPKSVSIGDFVNSLIIDLSASYTDGKGNPQVFHLTSGYHDKDLR